METGSAGLQWMAWPRTRRCEGAGWTQMSARCRTEAHASAPSEVLPFSYGLLDDFHLLDQRVMGLVRRLVVALQPRSRVMLDSLVAGVWLWPFL